MIQHVNMKKFFLELDLKLKQLMVEKELLYEENSAKIKFDTDDDLPLNKQLNFPRLIIIIRCVFQEDDKLYPQIYLDVCLYKL